MPGFRLSEGLVERLREHILAGAAAPGRPLRQDALAAELGVSKIPLREAMARLEQDGLLRSEANRGYFVRPLSAAEAAEVYELRLALEPETAARAAAQADEGERQAARERLERLDKVMLEHGDGVGMANRAFHLALLRPARRPVTFEILERLHVLSERYVRKHLEPLGRDERASAEHHDLFEAWSARDGETVAFRMRAHIAQTLADLRRQLPTER